LDQSEEQVGAEDGLRKFSFQSSIRTDVGRRRSENQDAYGLAESRQISLFVLADGMGGAQGGATASSIAVNVITRAAFREDGTITKLSLRRAIEKANRLIYDVGNASEELAGMGTTVVVVALCGAECIYAHVGDSRIYFIRDAEIKQLTRDHTLVQELVDAGTISPEKAANHPIGHMLTRALGQGTSVAIDIAVIDGGISQGDILLLCCDGLTNHVRQQEIARVATEVQLDEVADTLVDLANDRGGTDNITVVAVSPTELSPSDPVLALDSKSLPLLECSTSIVVTDEGILLEPEAERFVPLARTSAQDAAGIEVTREERESTPVPVDDKELSSSLAVIVSRSEGSSSREESREGTLEKRRLIEEHRSKRRASASAPSVVPASAKASKEETTYGLSSRLSKLAFLGGAAALSWGVFWLIKSEPFSTHLLPTSTPGIEEQNSSGSGNILDTQNQASSGLSAAGQASSDLVQPSGQGAGMSTEARDQSQQVSFPAEIDKQVASVITLKQFAKEQIKRAESRIRYLEVPSKEVAEQEEKKTRERLDTIRVLLAGEKANLESKRSEYEQWKKRVRDLRDSLESSDDRFITLAYELSNSSPVVQKAKENYQNATLALMRAVEKYARNTSDKDLSEDQQQASREQRKARAELEKSLRESVVYGLKKSVREFLEWGLTLQFLQKEEIRLAEEEHLYKTFTKVSREEIDLAMKERRNVVENWKKQLDNHRKIVSDELEDVLDKVKFLGVSRVMCLDELSLVMRSCSVTDLEKEHTQTPPSNS